AGADPSVVAGWIADTQAERQRAETRQQTAAAAKASDDLGRLTEDEIIAMLDELGDMITALRDAEPEHKLEVYRNLGLHLTYNPDTRTVRAEIDLAAHRWDSVRVRGGHENDFPAHPRETGVHAIDASGIGSPRQPPAKRDRGHRHNATSTVEQHDPAHRASQRPVPRHDHRTPLPIGGGPTAPLTGPLHMSAHPLVENDRGVRRIPVDVRGEIAGGVPQRGPKYAARASACAGLPARCTRAASPVR
ncbi:MAG TPA: hypothetical protein VFR67_27850, partial [Pilimelia sp.]|nr:hypothetical protein [Pilimelia sp.]